MSTPLPEIDEQALLSQLQEKGLPLPIVKPLLARIRDDANTHFRESLDAMTLVPHRAKLIDKILRTLWVFRGLPSDDLALIAVGGYGRGELHPFSDIDVLLLARTEDA
ncbi:MAG: nucleotidyltransferase domain-containing protein, partial [Thalassolituus sp.]